MEMYPISDFLHDIMYHWTWSPQDIALMREQVAEEKEKKKRSQSSGLKPLAV